MGIFGRIKQEAKQEIGSYIKKERGKRKLQRTFQSAPSSSLENVIKNPMVSFEAKKIAARELGRKKEQERYLRREQTRPQGFFGSIGGYYDRPMRTIKTHKKHKKHSQMRYGRQPVMMYPTPYGYAPMRPQYPRPQHRRPRKKRQMQPMGFFPNL